jgi:exosortase
LPFLGSRGKIPSLTLLEERFFFFINTIEGTSGRDFTGVCRGSPSRLWYWAVPPIILCPADELLPGPESHIFAQISSVNLLAKAVPLTREPSDNAQKSKLGWQFAVLGLFSIWIYLPILAKLGTQWWHDPNFSHGFFVPAFSAYVVWERRRELAGVKTSASWAGLPLLFLAMVVLITGSLGAELFLARFSLLLTIAALVILFLGWSFMRAIFFPWAFLLLMIPVPSILFNQITFPLQLLASKVAAFVLPWLGVPVLREGNVIELPAMALEVAEACSGIRSLLSLITLAIIYGYLLERRNGVRVALALASVPIAVAANGLRIVGTGLLVQYWDPDKAEGFFHAFSGWLIFVVSLSLLFLLHKAIGAFWKSQGEPA